MSGFEPTEVPRYRVTRDVHPSPNRRHRTETPFTSIADSDEWQFAERTHEAGEVIATTAWPHPSFSPQNDSARKVLDFFNSRMKSRMPRSPWRNGRVFLDDGSSQQPLAFNNGLTAA